MRAEVRDTVTGKTETIEADYMAGADGGASTVREQLGIAMSGTPAILRNKYNFTCGHNRVYRIVWHK